MNIIQPVDGVLGASEEFFVFVSLVHRFVDFSTNVVEIYHVFFYYESQWLKMAVKSHEALGQSRSIP